MEAKYRKYLELEINKHADRYHRYHNFLQLEFLRNKKRLNPVPPKNIKTPSYWKVDNLFNPFHVKGNFKSITRSVLKKLAAGTYNPKEPFVHEIPKSDGKIRKVSVFQIPDAAVSNMIYGSLLEKNKHRFSSLSYAYRNDRNVHYAIQDIGNDFKKSSRLFVAEFDFTDFFGSILHSYLKDQLEKNGFLISDFEKKIIDSFLKVSGSDAGISQGTSISLFLANVACWELDRSLEEIGLRFARYADDTVIWSDDYSKICKAYTLLDKFSKDTKVKINLKKSYGISLMTKPGFPSELKTSKQFVDFLGYKLSLGTIGIKDNSVRKIKKQISYILYKHLIQPYSILPIRGQIVPRMGEDPAFVSAMMQVRRYLYGGVNEAILKRFLHGDLKRINFKGLMSFYPLVDDEEQLEALDRWLVSTILKVLQKRHSLLINQKKIKHSYNLFPFNLSDANIIEECRTYKYKGKKGLVEIPSFLRIYRAIKKGLIDTGIESVMSDDSASYSYNE